MMDTLPQSRRFPIISDSSRPEDIAYLRGKGFDCVASKKGNGSVKAGITWLQDYNIVIAPECVNMLNEARLYSWQVDKLSKKVLPILCDSDNHGWDAIRYATEEARSVRKSFMKRYKF